MHEKQFNIPTLNLFHIKALQNTYICQNLEFWYAIHISSGYPAANSNAYLNLSGKLPTYVENNLNMDGHFVDFFQEAM
jgi:hypothetical protein